MSKYNSLWEYVQKEERPMLKLSFEEIETAKAKHNKVLDILKHSAETRLNNENKKHMK